MSKGTRPQLHRELAIGLTAGEFYRIDVCRFTGDEQGTRRSYRPTRASLLRCLDLSTQHCPWREGETFVDGAELRGYWTAPLNAEDLAAAQAKAAELALLFDDADDLSRDGPAVRLP